MTPEVRVLEPSEWDVWFTALERAFGGVPDPDEVRGFWREHTEYRRTLGAWDGGDCVGTAGAFSFRLVLPGGAVLPAAGITMVSVAATHRRRGLLTELMRRQLDDVHARGEALAMLTASEPAIYGRFGFGVGTLRTDLEIDTRRVRVAVPDGADELRLRFARPREAAAACEAVYARVAPRRPGMLVHRPESGWRRLPLLDPPEDRQGGSALQCVLAERAGEVVGYARFHNRPAWGPEGGPQGTLVLRDLEALDPAGHAALWRFLCSVDLTTSLVAQNRPADDPVQHLVSDIRQCRVRVRDGLYVRPVELGAALRARAYRTELDVVLDVTDGFCPWNAGRWRLTTAPGGDVHCARTADPADLALSVAELGAAYLGGTTLASLAGAGRVRELRAGALARASTAFGTDVAPWLPHGF